MRLKIVLTRRWHISFTSVSPALTTCMNCFHPNLLMPCQNGKANWVIKVFTHKGQVQYLFFATRPEGHSMCVATSRFRSTKGRPFTLARVVLYLLNPAEDRPDRSHPSIFDYQQYADFRRLLGLEPNIALSRSQRNYALTPYFQK